MSDGTLSFERGTTWKDGGTSTASVGAAVVGRSFRGNANNQPSGGVGGNVDQRLRVVKNTATAAITYTAARLRRGVRMSTAASGNNFDAINGFVSTKGARGFPLDDALPNSAMVSIINNDLVHIHTDGPCKAPLSRLQSAVAGVAGVAQAYGTKMAYQADGGIGRAQTGNFIVGLAGESFSSTQTGVEIQLLVGEHLGAIESPDGT